MREWTHRRPPPTPVPRDLLGGNDVHDAAAPATRELDGARRFGEQRVVLADAHALARPEARAALADDDLAAGHGLAGEDLHAEALGVGVAAVAGGAEALLVCHLLRPSREDVGDLDARELLAVAVELLVAALRLELEDAELRAALVAEDLGGDRGRAEVLAELGVVGAHHQRLKVDGGPFIGGQPLDEELVALLDAVLLA